MQLGWKEIPPQRWLGDGIVSFDVGGIRIFVVRPAHAVVVDSRGVLAVLVSERQPWALWLDGGRRVQSSSAMALSSPWPSTMNAVREQSPNLGSS